MIIIKSLLKNPSRSRHGYFLNVSESSTVPAFDYEYTIIIK